MSESPAPVFGAREAGECACCGKSFEQGDDVQYHPDGDIVGAACGCINHGVPRLNRP